MRFKYGQCSVSLYELFVYVSIVHGVKKAFTETSSLTENSVPTNLDFGGRSLGLNFDFGSEFDNCSSDGFEG